MHVIDSHTWSLFPPQAGHRHVALVALSDAHHVVITSDRDGSTISPMTTPEYAAMRFWWAIPTDARRTRPAPTVPSLRSYSGMPERDEVEFMGMAITVAAVPERVAGFVGSHNDIGREEVTRWRLRANIRPCRRGMVSPRDKGHTAFEPVTIPGRWDTEAAALDAIPSAIAHLAYYAGDASAPEPA
jgi:hypothetical protein